MEVKQVLFAGVCVSLLSLLSVAVPFSKFSYTVSWKRLYNALSNKCNNKKIISGCLRFVFCQLSRKISWSLPPRPCRCFRPLPGWGAWVWSLLIYVYIYICFVLPCCTTHTLASSTFRARRRTRIKRQTEKVTDPECVWRVLVVVLQICSRSRFQFRFEECVVCLSLSVCCRGLCLRRRL